MVVQSLDLRETFFYQPCLIFVGSSINIKLVVKHPLALDQFSSWRKRNYLPSSVFLKRINLFIHGKLPSQILSRMIVGFWISTNHQIVSFRQKIIRTRERNTCSLEIRPGSPWIIRIFNVVSYGGECLSGPCRKMILHFRF